jgi:hypothetical protein
MYYRIAIRSDGDHKDQSPDWKWFSTALGSLNSVLLFFQYYRVLPLDRLCVFASSSRKELKEQLLRENTGLGSYSVPARQFWRERFIPAHEETAEVLVHPTRELREAVSIGNATKRSFSECSTGVHAQVLQGMSILERRREETECGAGGDLDLPYNFTLPDSWPQARAWMRLLARVRAGELQP